MTNVVERNMLLFWRESDRQQFYWPFPRDNRIPDRVQVLRGVFAISCLTDDLVGTWFCAGWATPIRYDHD